MMIAAEKSIHEIAKEKSRPTIDEVTFIDHFTRRDKVAFVEGEKWVSMGNVMTSKLKQALFSEKGIERLGDAMEIAGKKKNEDTSYLLEKGEKMRKDAYCTLGAALKETSPDEREEFMVHLEGLSKSNAKKVYPGQLREMPRSPVFPIMISKVSEPLPGAADFIQLPSEKEQEVFNVQYAKYELARDKFILGLVRYCEEKGTEK